MFNATLAGHSLRAEYLAGSRGGSRAGSRFDLQEAGAGAGAGRLLGLQERLHLQPGDCTTTQPAPTCIARFKTCCYLSIVFSIILATIVIIIYVALGGLRGGGM